LHLVSTPHSSHSSAASSYPLIVRSPRRPPLFPYTTLFRSSPTCSAARSRRSTASSPPTCASTSSCAAWSGTASRKSCLRPTPTRSEEHTSELQSLTNLVCRLLLEKKKPTHPQRLPSTHTHT